MRFKISIMKISKFLFVLFLALSMGGSLFADKLRIKAGVWSGERQSELEDRFFLDDLIGVSGRLNLPWAGNNATSGYPLGLEYTRKMGPGSLVLGAQYFSNNNAYKYNGINLNPDVSIVALNDYNINNYEFDAGYQLKIASLPLFLTPRVGLRLYSESFDYDELTLGTNFAITTDGPWKSTARGLYVGGSAKYEVNKRFALVADFITTPPALPTPKGSMDHKRTILGTSTITIEDASSDTEVNIYRWSVGVEVKLMKNIGLFAGVGKETIEVSYPGYFNLPLQIQAGNVNTSATFTVLEIITDSIFYQQKFKSERGFFYVGVNLDIDL